MADSRRDLLGECNNFGVPEGDFKQAFCGRCRNDDCLHAGWSSAVDPFTQRVATQMERVLFAKKADPRLPQYARFVEADFADMTAQAKRLIVSAARGDWEIPEAPGTPEPVQARPEPEPTPQPTLASPTAQIPVKAVPPKAANTPAPRAGVMVGGGPIPQVAPQEPPVDPWAPPGIQDQRANVGGTIRLGGK